MFVGDVQSALPVQREEEHDTRPEPSVVFSGVLIGSILIKIKK